MADGLHGVLVVDKPKGPTSFAVVAEIRRVLRVRRAGHGGTLDPMATGVLPVCLGEGTKLAPFFLDADKEYEAEALLGVATDTYDATGVVVRKCDPAGVTEEHLRNVLQGFQGRIRQRVPAFSAVRQGGVRLYERARAREVVETPEREVEIRCIELLEAALPRFRFRVVCSKGTYVRSLAHDIGDALGVGCHLVGLRRVRTGAFGLEHAVPLASVAEAARAGRLPLIPPERAVAHLPSRIVTADVERRVRNGQRLQPRDVGDPSPGLFAVLNGEGRLVAVAQAPPAQDGLISIVRVFNISP